MFQNMPLLLLRSFESSARTGSFSLAAEELCITPSAISHSIRKLEAYLGTRLFDRTSRKIDLTPEGEALFEYISRGFSDLRQGVNLVSARGPTILRLHAAPSFAAQWLMPRLTQFFSQYPRIDLRLAANTNYARFEVDEFDVDIVYGNPKSTKIVVVPLGGELITPLCSPEVARHIHTPEDLLSQQLIQSESKLIRWPTWLEENKLPVNSQQGARFDRGFLAIAAAANGLGVALESARMAERELSSGRLIRPLAGQEIEIYSTCHYLVYSNATHRRHTIKVFTDWLLNELSLSAT